MIDPVDKVKDDSVDPVVKVKDEKDLAGKLQCLYSRTSWRLEVRSTNRIIVKSLCILKSNIFFDK